jgi:hypothetical protein
MYVFNICLNNSRLYWLQSNFWKETELLNTNILLISFLYNKIWSYGPLLLFFFTFVIVTEKKLGLLYLTITCCIFSAGIDTTRYTLKGAILHMVAFPYIQEKVQKEIDMAVGKKLSLTWYCRLDWLRLWEMQNLSKVSVFIALHLKYWERQENILHWDQERGNVPHNCHTLLNICCMKYVEK